MIKYRFARSAPACESVTLRAICSIQDSSGRVVIPAMFTTRSQG